MQDMRAIDLFCGCGGSSWGAQLAGAEIVAGFDKWELAGRVYQTNFPNAHFILGDLAQFTTADIKRFVDELGRIDIILASPECTSHSLARGAKEPDRRSLRLSWEVWRFARVFLPRFVVVENVPAMRRWASYQTFLREMERLGYHYREHVLNAAHFGVPQTRKRLYILFDHEQPPPTVHDTVIFPTPIRPFLVDDHPFVPLNAPNRAAATLERVRKAVQVLGREVSFIMLYYGSGPQWQTLDEPLRTITTRDHFALVRPDGNGGHEMRFLQPDELKAAMGFSPEFRLDELPVARSHKVRLLGNAVCPPVMQAIVRALLKVRNHEDCTNL